ncbi:hypothetical protein [Cellulomonas fimi]|uniref:hypothetical protein n=1 Tax=Cellulomonas fimi TaxID=1708 RepID=UPI001B85C9E6|nr:hypothetical protein [Cellulomonas fimi]
MPRYNAPPNWPAPPPGWAPAPDWRPDPAWGPPPAGWQLWLPEPGDGQRANRTIFGRVGIVAGAVWLAVMLAQAALGVMSARSIGAAFGSALFPWLLVSLVAFFRPKRWSWLAVVGVYLGTWLVLNVMSAMGRLAGSA